jgi:hypothetical protein
VVEPVVGIAEPVVEAARPLLAPVVEPVVGVVAPVVEVARPLVAPVVEPVVGVVAPVVEVAQPLVAPLVEVAQPLVAPVVEAVQPLVAPVVGIVAPVVEVAQPLLGPVLDVAGPVGDLAGTGSPAPVPESVTDPGALPARADRALAATPAPSAGPVPVVDVPSPGRASAAAPHGRPSCGVACTTAPADVGRLSASVPGPVPPRSGVPAGGLVAVAVPAPGGGGTGSARSGGPDGPGAVAVLAGTDPAVAPLSGVVVRERDAAPANWTSRPPSLPG